MYQKSLTDVDLAGVLMMCSALVHGFIVATFLLRQLQIKKKIRRLVIHLVSEPLSIERKLPKILFSKASLHFFLYVL